MKFYLSSYKLGNESKKLKEFATKGKIGYIPNALDFSNATPSKVKVHIEKDLESLQELGLGVETLNLRDYFNKKDELRDKLNELGAIFISGGNVFVLRQAMKLSGLDEIIKELQATDFLATDFLYAGYSAAGCVLSPTLNGYQIVDDATDTPYEDQKEVIWEGLSIIDYAFLPHWDSNHPESADINKEINYCKENKIPYKAIKDGEVIIFESQSPNPQRT
jgi:dipeptidase E